MLSTIMEKVSLTTQKTSVSDVFLCVSEANLLQTTPLSCVSAFRITIVACINFHSSVRKGFLLLINFWLQRIILRKLDQKLFPILCAEKGIRKQNCYSTLPQVTLLYNSHSTSIVISHDKYLNLTVEVYSEFEHLKMSILYMKVLSLIFHLENFLNVNVTSL